MKKVGKRIVIFLGMFVFLIVLVGLFLPSKYEITREIIIHAPKAAVHAYVGDLKKWDAWTPWKGEDPTVVTTLGEKTTGIGASQSWKSDSGDGRLILTACDVEKGIAYDLYFGENTYNCSCNVTYESSGDQTKVIWLMSGDAGGPILGGYFAMMMDPLIGAMFDKGLIRLKYVVESN